MAVTFWTIVITIVGFFGGTSAQVAIIGNCPDLPALSPFNLTAAKKIRSMTSYKIGYLGQWYEIEKYFTPFEVGGICVGARYTDLGNGSVEVYNTQINGISGNFSSLTGTARPANASSTEAKLLVNFPSVGNFDAPYWVMDTDYTDYSIVWSCRNSGLNSLQTIWFLSRTRTTTEMTRGYVYGFLNALRLNTDYLYETAQSPCTNP